MTTHLLPVDLDTTATSAPGGLTLLDLWRTVRRRRGVFFAALALTLGTAVLIAVFSTRTYEATGEIQIQKDATDGLGLDSLMSGAAGAGSDALDANVTLQTQAKILESQTLALEVIKKLHLTESADMAPHFSPAGWVLGLFSVPGPADPKGATLDDSPNKRDHAFRTFQANTKVKPVAGTRLIDVSYTSRDPKLAAATVNALIDGLVDYNFQTRYAATAKTSEWLGKQLSDLRSNSEELQSKVAALQRDSGVFSFGGQDADGKSAAYSTVLDQLQQTTKSLTEAQSNSILKGALYQASKSNDPDVIAGLANSPAMNGSSPAVTNTLALLGTLRQQEAERQSQLSQAEAKFGPGYPKLEEMRASLTSIQQSIHAEQTRLQEQTRSDAEIAAQVQAHLTQVFEEQKRSAAVLNDKSIQFQLLRQEAEQSRGLYENLLSRLKEAGVLEGLRSSNITVVEPGRVAARPSKPNLKLLFAGSLFGGVLLGLLSAFGVDMLDSKVHDVQFISQRFGDAYFGDLPFERDGSSAARLRSNIPLFALARPASRYSECLRGLRSAILLSRGGSPPKVLLITSSLPQEGKSTLSANLAALMAQQGKRVLLVDADLRRPTLHELFRKSNAVGLSDMITGNLLPENGVPAAHPVAGVAGLDVLTAGHIPPYPSELLGSKQMEALVKSWREQYDFVVLDAAPVLPVTDAVMLGQLADQILLVARHNVTEAADLERSFRLLHMRTRPTPIGIVLNAVRRMPDHRYYSYDSKSPMVQEGVVIHA